MLPETLEVEGSKFLINTDFRIGIMFEELMQDKSITDNEKTLVALRLYFKDRIPSNFKEAVKQMLWFYSAGKTGSDRLEETQQNKERAPVNKTDNIYSFEHDAEYIYSAFLSEYRIDLQDIEQLHWWKFRALFMALGEQNKIVKIMQYRAMKIDNNMSKEEKEHYKNMKKLYALPDNRTEEEKEEAFHEAFSGII